MASSMLALSMPRAVKVDQIEGGASTVIGRKRKLGGEAHLVARSGLRFTALTGAQHAALADSLQHLAVLPSILDSQQRTA
jgi:hypothetical protein